MSAARAARLTGAALLLAGGAVHLQLQLDGYGTAAIGRAFAFNAAISAVVAGYIALRTDVLGPIAGVVLSLGSLLALGLTRTGDGFLEFRESGFDPQPQTPLALGFELAAVVVLAALVPRTRSRTPVLP